jgi:sodium transport system permease protein
VDLRAIRLLAGKDLRAVLRNPRAWFASVVLPVLLYPCVALVALQATQVARIQTPPPARLLVLDLPEMVVVGGGATAPEVRAPEDPGALRAALRACGPGGDDPIGALAVRDELRRAGAGAVLWHEDPAPGDTRPRAVLAVDDASPQRDRVVAAAQAALDAWRRDLVASRLHAAVLPATAAAPVLGETWRVAAPAEAARSSLAGVLPVLLALIILIGVFPVAVDLIAGERERGSLETLLTLPVSRRDLIWAKLAVVLAAGTGATLCNLASLAATAAVVVAQGPTGLGADAAGLLREGGAVLVLALTMLIPVAVLVASLAVALASTAATVQEAQHQQGPFLLVVAVASMASAIPGLRPGTVIDLLPVAGPLIVLRACLEGPAIPWIHVVAVTAVSTAWAWIVVGWAVARASHERFAFPGLVRAGWGRWRRWGTAPPAPSALEAMGLFSVCLGLYIAGSSLLDAWGGPAVGLIGGLVLCLLLPALLFVRLGAFDPRTTLALGPTRARTWAGTALLVPGAILASAGWLLLQPALIGDAPNADVYVEKMTLINSALGNVGFVLAVSVAPAICEELLFRGPILAGLRRGLGATVAVAVQGVLFAAMHASPHRFLPQMTLGILLGALVVRTGAILPAVVIHGFHNGLLVNPQVQELLLGTSGDGQAIPLDPWTGAILLAGGLGVAVLGLIATRPKDR